MRADIITKLKAKREALDHQIASHKPLAHSVVINKIRAYATEHDMTEDDLFPGRYDPTADPVPEPKRNFRRPYPDFRYEDTLGYTFIADLKEQRFQLDEELRAIRREAIERAWNFIAEYRLTKGDIFSAPDQKAK